MKPYDPKDWYWALVGNTTQVYSSAVSNLVPITDPAFLAWKADGTIPSTVSSVTELGELLAQHLLRPIPPAILDAYKEALAVTMTPIDVLPQVIFMMENQIRALQGNPPLTFEQFRAFVKGLM